MQSVLKVLQDGALPEGPQAGSFRSIKSTIQVRGLPERFPVIVEVEAAREHPHQLQTVSLQALPEGFHKLPELIEAHDSKAQS